MAELITIVEGHIILAYAVIVIIGLVFLESMTRSLRYLAILATAAVVFLVRNPGLQLPGWIISLLP